MRIFISYQLTKNTALAVMHNLTHTTLMRQYSPKKLMDRRYFLPGTLPLLLWTFSLKEYHLIVLCGKTVFVQSLDLFLSCKEVFSSINRNVRTIYWIFYNRENVPSRNSNKNLMLIAVYSCNPFEDYHGITIQYNILQFLLVWQRCSRWRSRKNCEMF